MAPLIGHDNKSRNVHYGDGASEGAYRTARLYSRLGVVMFGIPAAILTAIAIWLLVDFASDLGSTWAQVFKFSLIAIAIGLASTGLPVWAGLLAQSNPPESRLMMMTWAGLLALAGLAMLFFVMRMDAPQPLTEQATARAAELHKALRSVSTAELAVWNRSDNCRAARDSADQAVCDDINARDARYRAELAAIEAGTWRTGWTPRDVIGTGHVAGMSDVLRRLLAALFTLLAMAGAGVLARWGAMGHAEAFRQADGIFAPPAAPVPTDAVSILHSDQSIFDAWFDTHIKYNRSGTLSSSAGFEHFERVCIDSGVQPPSDQRFYKMLAKRAKDSGGAFAKVKNSSMVYGGITLDSDDRGEMIAIDTPFAEVPSLTHRK